MKRTRILRINFNRMSQADFSRKAGEINMAINKAEFVRVFQTINPTAESIQLALTQYNNAMEAEQSKSIVALRHSTRAELTDLLVLLALNLEGKANGDRLMLSITGYDLIGPFVMRSGAATATPENLRLKNGLMGEIIAKVKSLGGRHVYVGAWTFDPNQGPWHELIACTNSQHIFFSGLERGREIYVRVRAIGPNGPGDWSDIAVIMVL